MLEAGALGPSSTAVHATHVTSVNVAELGNSGTSVCFCPTTERDLADGIGPARDLSLAGARLCLGTDSHAVIDPFEETRAIRVNERLVSGRRGNLDPEELLRAATVSGMQALQWDAGKLAVGELADFIAVRIDSIRMAGATDSTLLPHVIYAATTADVCDVFIGGVQVVADGRHVIVEEPSRDLDQAIRQVDFRVATS